MSRAELGTRRTVVGIAVILFQLAVPVLHPFVHSALHSQEIHSSVASSTELAPVTSASVDDADAGCPICTTLAHTFAAISHLRPLAVGFDAAPAAFVVRDRTLPMSDVTCPVARAPPPSPSSFLS